MILTEADVNKVLEDQTIPWRYGRHVDGKVYVGKWNDEREGFMLDASLLPKDNAIRQLVEKALTAQC